MWGQGPRLRCAALQAKYGMNTSEVLCPPGAPNEVVVIHHFPTAAQAQAFVDDPALKAAMESGGVSGPPRIEIFVGAK